MGSSARSARRSGEGEGIEGLRDALRSLIECPMAKAPVVDDDALVGYLTRTDLLEVIALKSDLAA